MVTCDLPPGYRDPQRAGPRDDGFLHYRVRGAFCLRPKEVQVRQVSTQHCRHHGHPALLHRISPGRV